METTPSTGLYTIVTDLNATTLVEQIRLCYENIGTVLRNKVYSTSKYGKIAILEVDDTETLIRASCRRVQSGDYQQQSIYTFRRQIPQIKQLINKKTKLKLTYDLQEDRDPQEFKESLLQLLSKVGGCYFIKKVKSLGVKNELILSIESSFSLSKLTSNSHFMFKQVKISFVHVEDKLEDCLLDNILLPEYITMSPNLFTKGANMNHVIQAFCERLFSRCKDEEEELARQKTRQDFRFWQSPSETDDKLEDLFDETAEESPDAQCDNEPQTEICPDALGYFIPENNFDFLAQFESNWLKRPLAMEQSESKKQPDAVFPCLNKALNNASALKKQGKQDSTEAHFLKDTALLVPVELKVIEMLQKMKNFSSSQSETCPQVMLHEVYSSIAGKIDPDTPPQQMLRVTLKILKTKYRKVKRRERKRDGRLGREGEDQDDSCDEDLLGTTKTDGHPLVFRVISQLQTSQETGYTFGSEELWRVLQSCDPEWRDFIWKYRTVDSVPESHFTALPKAPIDQKVCLQVQTSEGHHKVWTYGLDQTNFNDMTTGSHLKVQPDGCMKTDRDVASRSQASAPGSTQQVLQSYYLGSIPLEGTPNSFSIQTPDVPEYYYLGNSNKSPPQLCRPANRSNTNSSRRPPLTVKPAGSPTSLDSQDATGTQTAGDDRWIVQHIESNLRFNRMVSPILWR